MAREEDVRLGGNWDELLARPMPAAELEVRRWNIPNGVERAEAFRVWVDHNQRDILQRAEQRVQAQPVPWPDNIPEPAPVAPRDRLEEARKAIAERGEANKPMFLVMDDHGDGAAITKYKGEEEPEKAYLFETASGGWDEDGDPVGDGCCVFLTEDDMRNLAIALVQGGFLNNK